MLRKASVLYYQSIVPYSYEEPAGTHNKKSGETLLCSRRTLEKQVEKKSKLERKKERTSV
jgi:hypothetical protein